MAQAGKDLMGDAAKGATPGGAGRPWAVALAFLLLFLAISLVVKAANCWTLVRAIDGYPFGFLTPPASLPWLLGEELVIGGLLAVPVQLLARRRTLRRSGPALFCLPVLLALAIDQLAYEHLFAHLSYSLYQEQHDLAAMGTSILSSLDAAFFVLVAMAIGGSLLLASATVAQKAGVLLDRVGRHRARVVAAALAYLAVSLFVGNRFEQYQLQRSVFTESLVSSVWSAMRSAGSSVPSDEEAVLWRLTDCIFGKPQDNEDFDIFQEKIRAARDDGRKLNVVIYVIESLSWRESSLRADLGYDPTPFLKELARTGVSFENFYVNYPTSTRSDYIMNTGLYPYTGTPSEISKYSRIKVPIIADILHENGYTTAMFTSSDTKFDNYDFFLLNHQFDKYMDINTLSRQQRDEHLQMTWGVDEELMIDLSLAWIGEQAQQGRPFFLQYKTVYPHHPYTLPEGWQHLLEKGWDPARRSYQSSLLYADQALRRFYSGLRTLGLARNTIFLVTSDHGETFGDLHPFNVIHGGHVYEESVKVPLVIANPELFATPRASRRVGSQLDIFPTLLDLLGIARPAELHGQSLVSLEYRERPLYFASRLQLGLRDGHLKYVMSKKSKERMLFDLSSDPEEKSNLITKNKEIVERYSRIISSWQKEMTHFYENKLKLTKESAKKRNRINKMLRSKMYKGLPETIAGLKVCYYQKIQKKFLCPGEKEPLFDGSKQIAVKVTWAQTGPKAGVAYLYDPDGKRAEERRAYFKTVGSESFVRLATRNLRPGRWKLRVNMGKEDHHLFFQVGAAPAPTAAETARLTGRD